MQRVYQIGGDDTYCKMLAFVLPATVEEAHTARRIVELLGGSVREGSDLRLVAHGNDHVAKEARKVLMLLPCVR